MRIEESERGFGVLVEKSYQDDPPIFTRLIQESSAIGDDEFSFNNPGSSFLWVGKDHHLNREQVKELIDHMQYWLDNKHLKPNYKEVNGMALYRYENGMTVAELKDLIADWPETDEYGEPSCKVWLGDGNGRKNQVKEAGSLNSRESEDGSKKWSDFILSHDA